MRLLQWVQAQVPGASPPAVAPLATPAAGRLAAWQRDRLVVPGGPPAPSPALPSPWPSWLRPAGLAAGVAAGVAWPAWLQPQGAAAAPMPAAASPGGPAVAPSGVGPWPAPAQGPQLPALPLPAAPAAPLPPPAAAVPPLPLPPPPPPPPELPALPGAEGPQAPAQAGAAVRSLAGPGRGFPEAGPWVSFYGGAKDFGDLDALAARYRVFNVDADPGVGNFSPAQIAKLKAGGRNRVLSYLNLGAVESFRDYWSKAPAGMVPAGQNRGAQLGAYAGYADERWMNPANPEWRRLVLDHIVPRLVAQGIDGFYLDNLELLSHGPREASGPLPPGAAQAGLDLVREIRERYPNLLIVLQNGAGPVTRQGVTGGRPFAELLDGVAHESIFHQPTEAADARQADYRPEVDQEALAHMRAWRAMNLRPGGRPFHLSAQEYLGSQRGPAALARLRAQAEAEGFALHVADRSAGMQRGSAVGLQALP